MSLLLMRYAVEVSYMSCTIGRWLTERLKCKGEHVSEDTRNMPVWD
jgi:hypothetical protein